MTAMGAANRRDRSGVARCGQPIVNRSPDLPSLDGRIAGPVMPSNQEHDTVTSGDGLLQPAVDRGPCAVEAMAVQVEHPIGLNRARAKAPVPARVERRSELWCWTRYLRLFRTPNARDNGAK